MPIDRVVAHAVTRHTVMAAVRNLDRVMVGGALLQTLLVFGVDAAVT